jgi:caffeoyl-CoA O-methyltransferase
MKNLIAPKIAEYIHGHTTPESELLERLRAETYERLEDPQMQVGRVEGALLKQLVQISGARVVLELGTFSGYSGLSMASGLPDDGRLITCDIDPEVTAVARRFFDESPWGDKIEIRLGPGLETIDQLARDGVELDLVFIDADKENYSAYWEALVPLVRSGGILLADNTLWSGAVLQPETASDHAIVEFNRRVQADPRVENVLLSVRDGVMFSRKR